MILGDCASAPPSGVPTSSMPAPHSYGFTVEALGQTKEICVWTLHGPKLQTLRYWELSSRVLPGLAKGFNK